jgi:hypothetical protein
MTQNLNNVKPISVFEEHVLRAAKVAVGMANSLAMDIAIKALQAEENQMTDTLGAPGYYDAARLGLLWNDLASDTIGDA